MAATRILLVDDSEDIREVMGGLLRAKGFEVILAEDGEEALDRVRSHRPDLIITDISMPRMNGVDFLTHLRSDIAPPLPPVIVCSAFDRAGPEALARGAACFVAKPIDIKSFLRIVAEVLAKRRPDEAVAEDWRFAHESRSRAAATAARLFASLRNSDQRIDRTLDGFVEWIARYFAIAPVALAVVDGQRLKVAAVSHGSVVPRGMVISGEVLFSTGVLTAGSTLVLADARRMAPIADPSLATLGIGFIVAVPLLYDGEPFGALGMVDTAPQSFAAEELVALEMIGAKTASNVQRGPKLGERLGWWPSELFERLLASELALLHQQGGGFDLALLDVNGAVSSQHALELSTIAGPRLAVSSVSDHTVAIFKRDHDADTSSRAIATALSSLPGVRAAGWVSISAEHVPSLSRGLLMQLAWSALDQARRDPARGVERITIGGRRSQLVPPEAMQ